MTGIMFFLQAMTVLLASAVLLKLLRQERDFEERLTERLQQAEEKIEKRFASAFMEKVEGYLRGEQEIENWLQLAERTGAQGNGVPFSLAVLETALNRRPDSRQLMEKYCAKMEEYLQDCSILEEKKALQRYARTALFFLNNCRDEDWEYAFEQKNKVDEKISGHNKKIIEQKQDENRKILTEIEDIISSLETRWSEETVSRLEALDRSLSKELLKKDQELEERYKKLTEKMVALFKKEQLKEITPEMLRSYNQKVLEGYKRAKEIFERSKFYLTKGTVTSSMEKDTLDEISELLEGWDLNHVTPAVRYYGQFILAEILKELSPGNKLFLAEYSVKHLGKKKIEDFVGSTVEGRLEAEDGAGNSKSC